MGKTIGLTFEAETPAGEGEVYACPHCEKEYKSASALKAHCKKEHPEAFDGTPE